MIRKFSLTVNYDMLDGAQRDDVNAALAALQELATGDAVTLESATSYGNKVTAQQLVLLKVLVGRSKTAPAMTADDLKQVTGIGRSSIRAQLGKLITAGFVSASDGISRAYAVTKDGRDIFAEEEAAAPPPGISRPELLVLKAIHTLSGRETTTRTIAQAVDLATITIQEKLLTLRHRGFVASQGIENRDPLMARLAWSLTDAGYAVLGIKP